MFNEHQSSGTGEDSWGLEEGGSKGCSGLEGEVSGDITPQCLFPHQGHTPSPSEPLNSTWGQDSRMTGPIL